MELTAKELKERFPSQFEREYWRWVRDGFHYDWWDAEYDCFVADCEPMGITVDPERIYFSLSYSQGDYASFEGRIDMAKWMDHQGYSEKYLALRLDAEEFGAYGYIRARQNGTYVDLDYYPGQTSPTGVFSDLPQEAWDELVEEQIKAEDWEEHMSEQVRSLADDLYRRLQEEYEYLSSEEQFIESCECNDVTFYVDDDEECEA